VVRVARSSAHGVAQSPRRDWASGEARASLSYVNGHDAERRDAALGRSPTAATRVGLARPGGQGGVALPAAQERLARRRVPEAAAVWWLGAHGGAGESTLEELFSGSRAADHTWPLTGADRPPARVVVVARTHARGLTAAQSAIREWAAGDVEVLLLGLVLVADAPGRLPHELRRLADLVAGGAPAVWSLPWFETWRVGELPAASNAPKAVGRLLTDLQAMTAAPVTANVNRKEQ
jgi:hypothetical protein